MANVIFISSVSYLNYFFFCLRELKIRRHGHKCLPEHIGSITYFISPFPKLSIINFFESYIIVHSSGLTSVLIKKTRPMGGTNLLEIFFFTQSLDSCWSIKGPEGCFFFTRENYLPLAAPLIGASSLPGLLDIEFEPTSPPFYFFLTQQASMKFAATRSQTQDLERYLSSDNQACLHNVWILKEVLF